jgi:predicted P-loop ATPase
MEEVKDYLAETDRKLEETEKKKSWEDKLQKDVFSVKGVTVEKIKKCPDNIIVFLENHPKYAGKLKYNEYLRMKEYDGREFNDFDLSIINNDVHRNLGYSNKGWTEDSINEVFNKNRYNPVENYIRSQRWDGKKRIESLFIDLLDADDTDLNRKMTEKWMIAAVKRTLEPGCKFDNMIVLQGSQGIGKSTLCERLAKGFFSTISLDEIDNKDIVDKMNKTWIGIIDEMDNFNRKEMTKVKTFLSQGKDTVRLAYARNTTNFERHCIFIGSTNDDTFLRDSTSSVERRFWVIKCNKTKMDNKISKIMTPEYVDQLWAEAYWYYKLDPKQYLDMDTKMFEEFAKVQSQFKTYNDDDLVEYIRDILDGDYYINKDGEVYDISQLDNSTVTGLKYKINKIRPFVIRELLNRKFHEPRGVKYLDQALSNEWVYKDAWFKKLGKVKKAWVRKEEVKSPGKVVDPMDAFTDGLDI